MAYASIQEAASSCAYDSATEATPASTRAGAQHEEAEEVEVGCLHPSPYSRQSRGMGMLAHQCLRPAMLFHAY